MKFFRRLTLFLLFWSVIFGFVMGIFGISMAVIEMADFYITQGVNQERTTYSFRVTPLAEGTLDNNDIIEIRNIEGVAFVDPYFSPTNEIIGRINYFGFEASYPIQVRGIPRRLGQTEVTARYLANWDSANIQEIAVLLPQQAITLYNNLAPQQGWPSLQEDAFLGLPGISMEIGVNSVRAVIAGFDPNEFGTVISMPAQKLFSIYENFELNPSYNYFEVETVEGLSPPQEREARQQVADLGYEVENASSDNIQQSLFLRIKYTISLLGGSIFLAFVALMFYSLGGLYRSIQRWTWHYRIWGIKDSIGSGSIIISLVFSIIAGVFTWVITFFAVIPAQQYLLDSLGSLGISVPPLRGSAYISLLTGFGASFTFFCINIITIILFYKNTPKASYIKKF